MNTKCKRKGYPRIKECEQCAKEDEDHSSYANKQYLFRKNIIPINDQTNK